jgi:UDP-N-acetylmuramyl pentapeptide phosphotransferase/UDP-N-acetylglucosamine-1-phosphate transferase
MIVPLANIKGLIVTTGGIAAMEIMLLLSACGGVGIVVAALVGLVGWDSYGNAEEFGSAVAVYGFCFYLLIGFYGFLRDMGGGVKEARGFREKFYAWAIPLGILAFIVYFYGSSFGFWRLW